MARAVLVSCLELEGAIGPHHGGGYLEAELGTGRCLCNRLLKRGKGGLAIEGGVIRRYMRIWGWWWGMGVLTVLFGIGQVQSQVI